MCKLITTCAFLLVCFALLDAQVSNNVRSNRKNGKSSANKSALRSADLIETEDEREGQCELSISCSPNASSTRVPVSLPIRGPPGPPGPPGRHGEKGDPGEAGVPGKPGRNATPPLKVAFFAGLSHNWPASNADSDVVFDNVLTNVGSPYSNVTGRFVAPADGVYQFIVVIAAQGRNRAAVRLMHESNMVLTVWSESIPVWGTASNSAILALQKGQNVWVQAIAKFSNLHGYMYSTFSGHAVFATD